jgi:hypothetical protein
MQETRELNDHGNVEGKEAKVVVAVVQHAVASIDLGVELTDHACKENHGNTSNEEDVGDPSREAPQLGTL